MSCANKTEDALLAGSEFAAEGAAKLSITNTYRYAATQFMVNEFSTEPVFLVDSAGNATPGLSVAQNEYGGQTYNESSSE